MRHYLFLAMAAIACRPSVDGASKVLEARSPAIRNDSLVQGFGIETLGGRFTPILLAGCHLPCIQSSVFSTVEDSQTTITLHVLRGDSGAAASQHSLGHFAISGFAVGPRGKPQVRVLFSAIDRNLILEAVDATTGQHYTVARATH